MLKTKMQSVKQNSRANCFNSRRELGSKTKITESKNTEANIYLRTNKTKITGNITKTNENPSKPMLDHYEQLNDFDLSVLK